MVAKQGCPELAFSLLCLCLSQTGSVVQTAFKLTLVS